jgi:bifunctional DNA-binding transcriptional regulator/antitoxin component of YhaV-PrlF toxin-antitoxin module
VVIPAALRRALGLATDDTMVARVEGRRLVLEPTDATLERLRRRFGDVPDGVSLVDDLTAERRHEARREQG